MSPPHQEFNHGNGNLIGLHQASSLRDLTREQAPIDSGRWEGENLKHWDTNFPEKILTATVDTTDATLELWNVRTVPGSMYGEEKLKILENVYHRLRQSEQEHQLLAGDLNAPRDERAEGTLVPWGTELSGELGDRWMAAERNILTGLSASGMVDVFRTIHGYGDLDGADTSFQSMRFDHVIASESLNPVACTYDHRAYDSFDGTTAYSDHAPIRARFETE